MSAPAQTVAPVREPRRSPAVASATRREPPRAPVLQVAARRVADRGPSRRVVRRLPALALVAVALLGCGSAAGAPIIDPPTKPATVPAAAPRAERHASVPVRVLIPAIGVNAPLVPLGLDAQGALDVPARFDVAGWWTGGTRPGDRGPAVIAGHVDSKTGPAVFYRLGKLRRGDSVIVRRRDGTSVRFRVRASDRYAKRRFPTRRVYGPTRGPELRLITCSGTFDHAAGHYLDNTVVYATAT